MRKDAFSQAENEKHKKEINKLQKAAEQTRQWADKSERSKIGFDPVKENDRCISTRAYIGSKTKKMQSRVKQMEERIDREIEEKEGLLQDIENPVDLKLFPLTHHKEVLISAGEYGLQYETQEKPMFSKLNLEIKQGERVFLNGKNGCGKSSLIKQILHKSATRTEGIPVYNETGKEKIQEVSSSVLQESGNLQTAAGLKISSINQDTSFLKGNIKAFCKERELDESLFCALLRQLDMERVQFTKDMREFSEGQKKKVLIAASLMTPAHIYIWDEPLNYIDVFSRMQIEKLLLAYKPTMLLVDHDVYFREKIATKVVNLDKK